MATDHASAYPEVRTLIGVRLFSAEEIRAGERAWAALTSGDRAALRGHGTDPTRFWQADWLRRALAGYLFWSAWSSAAPRPAHTAQRKPG